MNATPELKTFDSSWKRHVQRKDTAQFREKYVSRRYLARDADAAPRSLLSLIEGQPAADPGVDANRQYFFRGADLMGLGNALVNLAPTKLGDQSAS